MRTDLIKRLARLWPSLLLILLAAFLFQSASKLTHSLKNSTFNSLLRNSALFEEQTAAKKKQAQGGFEALVSSPAFIQAWDDRNAITLFHEINSISRFLENMELAEQVSLFDDTGKCLVSMQAAETRIPDALTGSLHKDDDGLYLTDGGDLFQLTLIPFDGTQRSGTLQIWQLIDTAADNGTPASDIWASTDSSFTSTAPEVKASLLSTSNGGISEVVFDRKMLGELAYLRLEANGRTYIGSPLHPLTLFPSKDTSNLVHAIDVTDSLNPLSQAVRWRWIIGTLLLVLSIINALVLLRKCRDCKEHQLNAESRQIELEAALAEQTKISTAKDDLEQELAAALEAQAERDETQALLQARLNELESSEAELKALTDTLKAELDERPSTQSPEELDKANAAVAELKGLLQQSNTALEAALAEQAKISTAKDDLEQELAAALEAQSERDETQALLQTRLNELESSEAELTALTDTLKAELDERPTTQSPEELDKANAAVAELKGLLQQCNSALEAAHQEQNESLSKIRTMEQQLDAARKDVMKQEELMINQDAGNTVLEEQIELLKKQNAELEARVMGLQQAYMTTLEEFQAYREEFELHQAEKRPSGPMPPQMEFNLGVTKPTRPQKEIELPQLVQRLQERLVARKSNDAAFNLRKVCEKAIASQERDAHKHGLELALRLIPGTAEEVAGDPLALELLIANLLRFNTLATSDGFVPVEVAVKSADNKSGELSISFQNNGCSRSLHPWTDWVANPYQADCHENEVAAEWCAKLIDRLGGRLEVLNKLPNVACTLILPVQLTRLAQQESGPFSGETVAVLYSNSKRRQIVAEQLQSWGLNVEEVESASEMDPMTRVLIIDESQRQSDELNVIAEENPELPILLGDINRSDRFQKQLMTSLGYEPPAIEQTDLFG